MSSEIKANKLSPGSGSILTIGDSGDTVNIGGTAGTGFSGFLGVVVYTADGTYTPGNTNNGTAGNEGNAAVTKIIVEVQGAGGGGGGSGSGGYGAGAGGGGYSKAFRSLTDITTCAVTVGDGGTVSNNATGSNGGLSKIIKGSGSGTFADVQGAGGGGGIYSAGNGGEGGVGTGGFLHIKGGNGKPNLMGVTSFSAGGDTPFSPIGQHRGGATNPPDATHGYGGGGSGSANSSAGSGASGAEGADGIIIIYEFA
jgi:hypothetical protein